MQQQIGIKRHFSLIERLNVAGAGSHFRHVTTGASHFAKNFLTLFNLFLFTMIFHKFAWRRGEEAEKIGDLFDFCQGNLGVRRRISTLRHGFPIDGFLHRKARRGDSLLLWKSSGIKIR